MSTWSTVQPVSSGSPSPVRRGAAYWRRLIVPPPARVTRLARTGLAHAGLPACGDPRAEGDAAHTGGSSRGPQDRWAMTWMPAPREPSASA